MDLEKDEKTISELQSENAMLKEQVSVLEQELRNAREENKLLQTNLDFAMGKEISPENSFDANSNQEILENQAAEEMNTDLQGRRFI